MYKSVGQGREREMLHDASVCRVCAWLGFLGVFIGLLGLLVGIRGVGILVRSLELPL